MSVSESSFPGGVARCQHIRSNGTQCGSPALKSRQFCYYHHQSRPEPVELYIDGDRYSDGQIIMPLFEDAHSIQVVLRQVTQLLLQRRIDRKDAALALYALQIASSNLKRMEHEKPRPTQVVIDPETVAETPLGMTPWSATGTGHDPDDFESASDDSAAAKALPERADEDLPPGIIHACQPVNAHVAQHFRANRPRPSPSVSAKLYFCNLTSDL